MRHRIRRTIELIALALILFPMWSGAIAEAGPLDASLRGDYSVTMTRTCQVIGLGQQLTIVVKGSVTYNGSGGGSFTGQALAVDAASATQSNQTCSVTYTVNADGSVTQQLNCNLTFTNGVNAGQTGTLNGIAPNGQLSLDGTVLLLSDTGLNTETFTVTSGPNTGTGNTRICNGSGLATSRR